MGGPTRQAHVLDGALAAEAVLARPSVDTELVLEGAAQTRTADVIADAGAALGNGPAEHLRHGLTKPADFAIFQTAAQPGRVQPGGEERLIGVDIADPGHHA